MLPERLNKTEKYSTEFIRFPPNYYFTNRVCIALYNPTQWGYENETTFTANLDSSPVFEQWVSALVMLPIMIFGMAGSLISAWYFWGQFISRGDSNLCFLCLAIADFVFLLLNLLIDYSRPIVEFTSWPWLIGFRLQFNYKIPLLLPIIEKIAQHCCIWITVGLSVQRFVALKFPLNPPKQLQFLTIRRYLLGMLLVLSLYNLKTFFEVESVPCEIFQQEGGRLDTEVRLRHPGEWSNNKFYVDVILTVSAIFIFIVPFVILFVMNYLLILLIKSARTNRASYIEGQKTRQVHEESSSTKMLVTIVAVFLVANTMLFFVQNIILMTQKYWLMQYVFPWASWAATSNPLANAIVYFIFIRRYRSGVHSLLAGCCSCCRWLMKEVEAQRSSTSTRTTSAGSKTIASPAVECVELELQTRVQ